MHSDPRWTRRTALQVGLAVAATALMSGCGGAQGTGVPGTAEPPSSRAQATTTSTAPPQTTQTGTETQTSHTSAAEARTAGALASEGRLTARPTQVTQPAPTGLRPLGLVAERDVLLYVPPTYRPEQPAPLVVTLHGAGGDAPGSLGLLQSFADERGLILVGLASRDRTWDVIVDGYGPDIAVINQALAQVFQSYAVDPQRLAIGGFSDGASYALSVGINNGDLFRHVLAFSPGSVRRITPYGTPRFFIAHGTEDEVLPIDRCSRQIVPQLQQAGYDVLYREFEGPHIVPPEIARAAVDWYSAGLANPSGTAVP